MACLYADGKLAPGEIWRQESLIGSLFEGFVSVRDGVIYPHIKGSAFVNSEANLVFDERDPFRWGIRPDGVGTATA
jgi:4-hydroxyproline epimerase